MKIIFDESIRIEVISRINLLSENNKPAWGKMTVVQMIKHCAICEEYYFGNVSAKRSLLGKILGKGALKQILKDDTSGIRKNAPTAAQFRVNDTNLNFETEKGNWIRLIKRYEGYNKENFTHWFFGAMTKEQLGQFIYKHTDHHLKQFGV